MSGRLAFRRSLRWVGGLLLVVITLLGRPNLLGEVGMSAAVYDRHHRLLRLSLAPDDRYRLPVTRENVAPAVIDATLLYEDRWFYWHPGVNPWALAKATVQTARGGKRRGASTITMQLARLRFSIDSGSIAGKIYQILRAAQLELYYSKDDILAAYLTLAPYGGNIEGIAAASRVYFDKEPGALSLAEALALAVMPQRPTERRPTADGTEPEAMRTARRKLTAAYLHAHPGTAPAEAGLTAPLALRRRNSLPFLIPHAARSLSAGPEVITTLDLDLQQLVERRLHGFVGREQIHGIENTAAMLVDYQTMDVLAVVGSADFFDASIQGQVDGTRAKRSPGSALKPFVYALALQAGLIHPLSLLKDAPMRFGTYNPENFDGEFEGPITATAALIRSRNVPAVYLETELRRRAEPLKSGVGGLYDLLSRAGISELKPAEHYGLALVLGGLEVTMRELVQLYAMLARYGTIAPLRYRLESPISPGEKLISPEAAALTLEMLRSDGTELGLDRAVWVRDEIPIAWKTGTSYGFRDAWTIGVVGRFVLAVWVGNFNSRGNPSFIGRRAAAPLFFEIVEALRPEIQAEPVAESALNAAVAKSDFPTFSRRGEISQVADKSMERLPRQHLHVSAVDVCAISGQIPNRFCPRTERTRFIPGVSPIATCEIHRELRIERRSGLRACPGERAGTEAMVFEFWPSDLLRLFDRAGLPRVRPPAFAARCEIGERALQGHSPVITSPQPNVVYTIRARSIGDDRVPFAATADADVELLRWFVGERFVGETNRTESLMWSARPGDFVIRVVDDSGRSAARPIRVAVIE